MRFTPLSVDPSPIVIVSDFDEIGRIFQKEVSVVDFRRNVHRVGDEYALKVLKADDPETRREMGILRELQTLNARTQVFLDSPGYVFDAKGDVVLFTEWIPFPFSELPDTPVINEQVYLELLIGLYCARRDLGFRHNDIHSNNIVCSKNTDPDEKNFFFNDDGYYVPLGESKYDVKLIDYGRATTREHPKSKGSYIHSDVFDLTKIFFYDRKNYDERFRRFLIYVMSLFQLPNPRAPSLPRDNPKHLDAEARPEFIERLIREYFDGEAPVGKELTWRQERFMKEFLKMKK